MPNTSLHSALAVLADNFATAVLAAIRGASLEDLVVANTSGAPQRTPSRSRGSRASSPRTTAATSPAPKRRKGRLSRRSPEDIAKTLASVIALLKGKKAGLRSENIQNALELDRRELPRVLKQGLSAKKLKSKGQKRSTTYFAA